MPLIEQLRAYIAPDDGMEDHDDIRALMHAGADRIEELECALSQYWNAKTPAAMGAADAAAAKLLCLQAKTGAKDV